MQVLPEVFQKDIIIGDKSFMHVNTSKDFSVTQDVEVEDGDLMI